MPDRVVLHVVPHTHWDREWYEPFEGYRFKLIKVVDQLLEVLETDPGFRHFNFDGQTAAIEDYLEIRPGAEGDVRALVEAGRLAVGPWRILMDEFLCSPETILRNLRQGTAQARALGRAMKVGYIPDSFGHVSQMPQIMSLAGLDVACVWRGIPRAVDRTTFWWEAPDGSRVRAAYLATSYSNAATLPDSVEDLIVRAERILADLEPFEPGGVVLAMNGSDHRAPEPHLPELFAKANAHQDRIEFRIGSMEDYLADAPAGDALPVWRGEMRSGARANLLMGVVSARMPLKQAEATASALLERYAEPLSVLAGTDTGRLLERAWRAMVENSAHDSICGCGIDVVAEHVAARYRDAARIAELVTADALTTLTTMVDTSGCNTESAVVFNPSPHARGGVVEVSINAPGDPSRLAFRAPGGSIHPAQVLAVQEQVVVDMTLRGEQLARIVPTIHSRLLGDLYVNGLSIERGRTLTVHLRMGAVPDPGFDIEGSKLAVEAVIAEKPKGRFRVLGMGPPLCRTIFRAPEIGAMGWTTLEPVSAPPSTEGAARADGNKLDNGILHVEVDARGRASVTVVATGVRTDGLFALVDGADAGDEYNYSPPDNDLLINEPTGDVVVDSIADGPVEATLRVTMRYRVPAGLTTDERGRTRRNVWMPVTIEYTLRAGEPFLRAAILIQNNATDHRLRVLMPLGTRVERSHADGAFHVVERGLTAEGGVHEHGLPTFPSRRWVDCSDGTRGLAVFHRGTPEYEIIDEGATLAVTLLRCVGWLSRQGMHLRAGPAGPKLQAPGAQLLGDHRFEFAVYPHEGNWSTADVHGVAESFTYPLRAAGARPQSGPFGVSGEALGVEPSCVRLSACLRDGDRTLIRVVNACEEAVEARITLGQPLSGRARAEAVDIHGAHLEHLSLVADVVTFPMRAWQIVTVALS